MTATLRRNQRGDPPDDARRRIHVGERLTLGHIAPILLAVLAALLVSVALSDRSAVTQVPVATGAIAAGAPVDSGDTHLVALHSGDAALRAGLLPTAGLGQGWVAAEPIRAGDAITRSEVARAASGTGGLGAMSLPVPPPNADGGAIVAGDRVDVIAASGPDGAQYVAQDLRVISVASSSSGSSVLATNNNAYYVVVAVDRTTALRLATALAASTSGGSSAGIEVVRTTGEAPASVGGAN